MHCIALRLLFFFFLQNVGEHRMIPKTRTCTAPDRTLYAAPHRTASSYYQGVEFRTVSYPTVGHVVGQKFPSAEITLRGERNAQFHASVTARGIRPHKKSAKKSGLSSDSFRPTNRKRLGPDPVRCPWQHSAQTGAALAGGRSAACDAMRIAAPPSTRRCCNLQS